MEVDEIKQEIDAFVAEVEALRADPAAAFPTLMELRARIADLQKRVEAVRDAERPQVISDIREKVALYGIGWADIFPKRERKHAPARVKFRDPVTGGTWTGRGRMPVWLRSAVAAGRKAEDFAV